MEISIVGGDLCMESDQGLKSASRMKAYNVAVIGATGAVGAELLRVLERRNFPVNRLRAFGSSRSVGKAIKFGHRSIAVEQLAENVFTDLDIAFFSAGGEISRQW